MEEEELEKIVGAEKRREFTWKEEKCCRDFKKEDLVYPIMLTPHWTRGGEMHLAVCVHTHKDFSGMKWKVIKKLEGCV